MGECQRFPLLIRMVLPLPRLKQDLSPTRAFSNTKWQKEGFERRMDLGGIYIGERVSSYLKSPAIVVCKGDLC